MAWGNMSSTLLTSPWTELEMVISAWPSTRNPFMSSLLPTLRRRTGFVRLPYLPGSPGAADQSLLGDFFGLFALFPHFQCGCFDLLYLGFSAEYEENQQPYVNFVEQQPLAPLVSGLSYGRGEARASIPWHGPTGGHDQRQITAPRIYDLFDLLLLMWGFLEETFQCWAAEMQVQACASGCTFVLIQAMVLLVLLWTGGRSGSGRGHRMIQFRGLRVVVALAIISNAGAVRTGPTGRTFPYQRPPQQTDLELWASGQLTIREQMCRAWCRHIAARSVEHSAGEADAPCYTASAEDAQALLNEANLLPRTIHITVWLATPYYEEEILDMGVAFPQTREGLERAIYNTSRALPSGAEEIVFTTPQMGTLFASCVAVPRWLPLIGKTVQVLDCTKVGGAAFAYYHQGPITRESLCQLLPPDEDAEEVDFFVYGGTRPIDSSQSVVPIQGGLIQAMYRGETCEWADDIEARLSDVNRWDHRAELPASMEGRYVVYQSRNDQIVFSDYLNDERNILHMAEQLFGFEERNCWIGLPTEPLAHLSHAGRNITRQIAVLEGPRDTPLLTIDHAVAFVDLRELGMFPQWIFLEDGFFDPTAFLDDIGFPTVEGWTVIIEGGDPCRPAPCLEVRDGETLRFFLREGSGSSRASSSDGSDGSDDQGPDHNDDSGSSGGSSLLDSSDLSEPPAPNDGVPRGPPPPQPVDRSRSPRRRQAELTAPGPTVLKLSTAFTTTDL